MDEKNITTFELVNCWEKLNFELKKNKKIDFDFFCDTFTRTYSLLTQFATTDSLDKKYIELISTAFLFANNLNNDLNGKCRAILTLTERMINCCAFNISTDIPQGTNIYILDSRKDVYINFNDIDESVMKLEKLFEENFWKNI